MRIRLHRSLVLTAVLLTLSPLHCRAIDPPLNHHPVESLNQGLPDQDLQQWYHLSAGTQLIPYDWLVALLDESLAKTFAVTGLIEDTHHPDKLPVGFAKTEGPSVAVPQVGFTCSFCHTTQFRYKGHSIRIEGGPSLQNNATVVRAVVQKLGTLTPPDMSTFIKSLKEETPPEPFKTFATRVLARRGEAVTAYTLTKLAQDVKLLTQALISRSGKDISPEQWGPGRFDALGRGGNTVFTPLNPDNLRPANAPVSIPPLWGVWEFDWVQWAGSIQHPLARNIGQVIGVNAGLFSWARPGVPIPSDKNKVFHSSIDVASLTTLENLARRLPPPQWPSVFPPVNRELATRGKDLYHGNKAKGIPNLCAHCHVPSKISNSSGTGPSLQITMVPLQEIGTDSLYLENFSQRTVDTSFLGRGRISAREASEYVTSELMTLGNDTSYLDRPNIWRDKAQYIARPHLGIWATAPYLHNGSIPTLYELLSPARERRACFVLDPNMEFDPEKVGFVTGDCAGPSQAPNLPPRLEFRTAWPGNSNRGHEFANTPDCDSTKSNGVLGCELPANDRLAIIEYLKTCDLDRLVLPNAPACPNFD
ncbi:MAG: di-heme-cytochrome C peroxidase [Nitrospira sp.]